MTKPMIHIYDCVTGQEIVREMTDDEYQALLDSGLTPADDETTDE